MDTKPVVPQEETSEPVNALVSFRCTATEKNAIRFLALSEGQTESEFVRIRLSLDAIVTDADRRRELSKAA